MATGHIEAPPERSIIISRTFDAPREVVFAAFTDREHIGQWWGPDGFTTTTKEMDVRVGGVWRYTMHGPDGIDYPNIIEYTEVTPPERLLYRHGDEVDGVSVGAFDAEITFQAQGARTLVTLKAVFETAEVRQVHAEQYGAIEGGKQTLARLEAYLESRAK